MARDFRADPDRVWAVVGDFSNPGPYITDLKSIEVEGDDRVLTLPNLKLRETLLERDDAGRRLVYSVVSGLPIDAHRGEITVTASGTGSTVTWAFEVSPDNMEGPLRGVYEGALAALKRHFGE